MKAGPRTRPRATRNRTPSLPLAGYAGGYRDAWYGDVFVEQSGGKLRLRFGKTAQLVGTLEHWQHDTFIVRWDDRSLNADAFVNFSLDPDGKVREVRMQADLVVDRFQLRFPGPAVGADRGRRQGLNRTRGVSCRQRHAAGRGGIIAACFVSG